MTNVFDIIRSISKTKQDLSEDKDFDKEYNTFLINRYLSMFSDSVLYVNEINKYHQSPNDFHYCYLINTLRAKTRNKKWIKAKKNPDLELVMQHYGYNYHKAKEALNLLSKEQIEYIRKLNGVKKSE